MLELISQSYNRTSKERVIAIGRLILSAFSLLAIYFDPSEPARHAELTYALLSAYVVYAAVIVALIQCLPIPPSGIPVLTHVVDLGAFFVLTYFTEGPTSPFFVFFVFSIICATIRWQWKETLLTGLVAVVGFIAMGIYTAEYLQDPAFELNRFLIRSVYLAVLVVLLGYLGAYGVRLQQKLAGLVAWPTSFAKEEVKFFRELLEQSLAMIAARRIVMVWSEKNNGAYHTTSLRDGEFQSLLKPQFSPQSLVSEPLAATSFLCNRPLDSSPRVVYTTPDGFAEWRGVPLVRDFQIRFAIDTSVLSAVIRGEFVDGRLFLIGKRAMNSDDLMLAEIVAHMIATRLDNWHLLTQLQEAAATKERVQLANSLHDTVFQSLAVTGLQMEVIGQLLQKDPDGARHLLAKAQERLFEGTQTMRSIVTDLKAIERTQDRNAVRGKSSQVRNAHRVAVRHGRA